MSEFIRELERHAHDAPHALDRWLEGQRLPRVDGRTVTFVFHGEADTVHLRHWIFGLPSSQAFTRIPGSMLFHYSIDLPENSRVEYKLEVARGQMQRLVADPLNTARAQDPFGSNSVVHGAGYEVPPWTEPEPDTREGHIEEHELHSDAFGGTRSFQVYFPARYRTMRRYPLLVAHDGQDYLRFSRLKRVLDNLIHRLELPSMVVALIQSPDRMREYADDPRHAQFLVRELVPHMEVHYPLLGPERARTARRVVRRGREPRRPRGATRVLRQPDAAVGLVRVHRRRAARPRAVFDPVVAFMNSFRNDPGRPAEKVFMTCGQYESLIYYNRSLFPFLQQAGMDVRFRESRDGHNWQNWRDGLREGLSYLFPGPLWFVYE
jgi:enterochelin esterase family protein